MPLPPKQTWGGIPSFVVLYPLTGAATPKKPTNFRCRPKEKPNQAKKWLCKLLSWIFELFDLVWGLRNEDEHGIEPVTQRLIKLAKCECAIWHLYEKSIALPYCEEHPFRQPSMVTLLARSLKRARQRTATNQHAITEFYKRAVL
jgi:hypothetical protein